MDLASLGHVNEIKKHVMPINWTWITWTIDGVLGVLSSNQLNIAIFVHQMGDTHTCHLVDISSNI